MFDSGYFGSENSDEKKVRFGSKKILYKVDAGYSKYRVVIVIIFVV